MKRRKFLKYLARGISAGFTSVAGLSFFSCDKKMERPPNILLILADDVGREVLGCYGGTSYATPNIDSLATSGMRFSHCYSMPVCHPTRISLLTGRYPARLGNPEWGSFPKKEEGRTVAQLLKAAGYTTAVAGKWQLTVLSHDPAQPQRMGFDESCLFAWHEGPRYHDPMVFQNGELRTDTKGKYGPDLYVEFLIDFMKKNRDRPFWAYYPMALCHDVTNDLKGKFVPFYKDGRWMTYAEMVASMDEMVGRVVAALDELGLREDTLILFTADNGTPKASYLTVKDGKMVRVPVSSEFGGQKITGGKGQLTDWGTRVPLIANWQGRIAPGQVVDDLVDFADFLPTLTDLAGGRLPEGVTLDGVSFARRLRGQGASPKPWACAEFKDNQRWVRTRRWKLYQDGRFYDMKTDPDEKRPLKKGAEPAEAVVVRQQLQDALDSLPPIKS